MKKDKERLRLPNIYAAALHEINKVIFGRKLILTRGCKLLEKDEDAEVNVIREFESWTYDDFIRTWVNESTGKTFTKTYIPTKT